ncbi:MAG TPA: hypothetical protein PLU20_10415 [Ornithinibacter sp.]|nr:hypothetical protein [Ornithinibacter sp.]
MRHLLVTNDFPPKVGGIQTYLWELWRRLDPNAVTVLATPHAGAADFDAAAPFEIRRTRDPVLLPHPALIRQVNRLAAASFSIGLCLLYFVCKGLLKAMLGMPMHWFMLKKNGNETGLAAARGV